MSKPSFETLGLKKDLINGIFAHGFEEPSKIQETAIPAILTGKDVICQAQSGTGKTAAFVVSALQKIDVTSNALQVLIIAPTRELAQQDHNVAVSIGQRMNLKTYCFYGGMRDYDKEVEALTTGIQLAVGTTGTVIKLLKSGKMNCSEMKMIIIDEADQMLEDNFQQDIATIFKACPKQSQIVLVSATMPAQTLELCKNIMTDPINLLVKEDELTLDGIRQYQIPLQEEWKTSVLLDIFKVVSVSQAIIFLNGTERAKKLFEALKQKDFACQIIVGDMEQTERNRVMAQFRKGEHRVLVATNVIARGIDVQNVSLVVNYDIPRNEETYLHRIGRSGRFGRKGFAVNFVTERDKENIEKVIKKFATKIDPMPQDLSKLV